MANSDRPRGFEPQGDIKSQSEYQAGGIIYPGDAVKMDSDGEVVVVTASDAILGVAMTYASGQGQKVLVSDHVDQKYLVQADGADIDAQTDINLNYNVVATAGDSTFRDSRMELDSDSGATTATLPLKLLSVGLRIDNALGAQADCIVKINNHQLAGGTGTAGV